MQKRIHRKQNNKRFENEIVILKQTMASRHTQKKEHACWLYVQNLIDSLEKRRAVFVFPSGFACKVRRTAAKMIYTNVY